MEKTFERFDTRTNTMRPVPGRYQVFYGTSSAEADLKSIIYTLK
jgi:beta-glucosidase